MGVHDYKGVDGASYTPTNLPGKGQWVTPQVPDDGNDRDAATVGIGQEGLADRTVYLALHMVDGLVGGSYAADFGWTGGHLFSGSVSFTAVVTMTSNLTVGGTLGVTGAVSLANNLSVAGNTSLIGTFSVLNASTFNGFVTFNKEVTFNDPLIVNDTLERVGDDAWEGLRSADGPDATTTINPWEQDVWTASLTADRQWTLADGPAGKVFRVAFLAPSSNAVLLKDSAGNGLYNMSLAGGGTYRYAELIWAKTQWLRGPRESIP